MITSRRDPILKPYRAARDGEDSSRLFAEGVRLAEELARSSLTPKEFIFTPALASNPVIASLRDRGAASREVDEQVMGSVSDVKTPPGLIVLAGRPHYGLEDVLKSAACPLLAVLDGLQLPNNVGAVLRAAEAAGAHAVLQLAGGADILGPKVLRASAGAAFRLPALGGLPPEETIRSLESSGIACVSADPRGEVSYQDYDWTKPTALFLSSESDKRREASAGPRFRTVRVPMRGRVESLNVAVAAGILLYEAFRQRSSSGPGASDARPL